MADKSVTIRFTSRPEADPLHPGYNQHGHELQARLEIDTAKTAGDEPYKVSWNIFTGAVRGQDVWLNYYSNADPGEPIIVKTTNGTATLMAQNLVSATKTETHTLTNTDEVSLSGIPKHGSMQTEWVGNVLTAGDVGGDAAALCAGELKAAGPNMTFDGEKLTLAEPVTGILKVTYTETYAQIKSNAAPTITTEGNQSVLDPTTIVVAVCQGKLATAADYEIGYPGHTWTVNPDSDCCADPPDGALSVDGEIEVSAGENQAVSVSGGCTPFHWDVDGVGMSMNEATTDQRFNTIILEDHACGEGILTVSDDCGTSVTSTIRVVYVRTGPGGLLHTELLECCADEDGTPLEWPDYMPDVLCPSSISTFGLSGGVAPYQWTVETGADIATWQSESTDDPVNTLTVGAVSDELREIRLRVRDACGEILTLNFDVGFMWAEDNPETIGQNDDVVVSVEGGKSPYSWTVSGTGFSIAQTTTEGKDNVLYADAEACGSAEITVTDACGVTVEGGVRGEEGQFDSNPRNGVYFWGDNTDKGSHTCGGTVFGIYKYHLQWYTGDPKYPCADDIPAELLANDPYGLAGSGSCTYFCNAGNEFSCYRSELGVNWYPEKGTVRITRIKWEC